MVGRIISGVRANDEARRQFAGRYLLNTLTNVPVIARESNVTELFGLMTGVPAMIVAAGPSLNRNIEDLKAVEGRALIVAVDTAVRPLLTAGVQPHLAVSVDPSDINARHLQGSRTRRTSRWSPKGACTRRRSTRLPAARSSIT